MEARLAPCLALICGGLFPAPALACRLALLLAVDVSSSIDAEEYQLQSKGLAAALLAPDVQAEILSWPDAPVALAVYEFSGRYQHKTVLDWTLLSGPSEVLQAAETISTAVRSETEFPTSIGYALGHAASLFRAAPNCSEYKLDLSGDGRNNEGFKPSLAYRNFPLAGITVNALAIGGAENPTDLARYYFEEVIKGPGAFVEIAEDHHDFERAMRKKLLREMQVQVIGALTPPVNEG